MLFISASYLYYWINYGESSQTIKYVMALASIIIIFVSTIYLLKNYVFRINYFNNKSFIHEHTS